MSLSNKSKISFFEDVPRELRDMIYHHLLEGVSLTYKEQNSLRPSLYFQYGDTSKHHHSSLPEWMFVSKQMVEEACDQWYHRATCALCFSVRSRVLHIRENGVAASFCDIDRVQSFDAVILSIDDGNFLTEYLRQHPNHPAKQLRLTLPIPPSRRPFTNIKVLDVSYLRHLGPRFHLVKFKLTCPLMLHPPFSRFCTEFGYGQMTLYNQWSRRDIDKVFVETQHKALEVAKYFVGAEETNLCELHDYLEHIDLDLDSAIHRKGSYRDIHFAIPPCEWSLEAQRGRFISSEQVQHWGIQCLEIGEIRSGHKSPDNKYLTLVDITGTNSSRSWFDNETGYKMRILGWDE